MCSEKQLGWQEGLTPRGLGGWGRTFVSIPKVVGSHGKVYHCQQCYAGICILKITKVINTAKFYYVPGSECFPI